MSVINASDVLLEDGVLDFFNKFGNEAALTSACEIVRECVPELQTLRVWLLEDPDEDNHTWVVLQVMMPGSHSVELVNERQNRFCELLTERLPLPYHPFSFSLELLPATE